MEKQVPCLNNLSLLLNFCGRNFSANCGCYLTKTLHCPRILHHFDQIKFAFLLMAATQKNLNASFACARAHWNGL